MRDRSAIVKEGKQVGLVVSAQGRWRRCEEVVVKVDTSVRALNHCMTADQERSAKKRSRMHVTCDSDAFVWSFWSHDDLKQPAYSRPQPSHRV